MTRVVLRATVVDDKTVVDGRVTVLRHFEGPTAETEAIHFIETLPDYLTGRYGLDVSYEDDQEG